MDLERENDENKIDFRPEMTGDMRYEIVSFSMEPGLMSSTTSVSQSPKAISQQLLEKAVLVKRRYQFCYKNFMH
jgi:hypothetical protein